MKTIMKINYKVLTLICLLVIAFPVYGSNKKYAYDSYINSVSSSRSGNRLAVVIDSESKGCSLFTMSNKGGKQWDIINSQVPVDIEFISWHSQKEKIAVALRYYGDNQTYCKILVADIDSKKISVIKLKGNDSVSGLMWGPSDSFVVCRDLGSKRSRIDFINSNGIVKKSTQIPLGIMAMQKYPGKENEIIVSDNSGDRLLKQIDINSGKFSVFSSYPVTFYGWQFYNTSDLMFLSGSRSKTDLPLSSDLCKLNIKTNKITILKMRESFNKGLFTDNDFSNTPDKIAVKYRDSIYLVDISRFNVRQLTKDNKDSRPSFSSDNKSIYFVRNSTKLKRLNLKDEQIVELFSL